MKFIDSHEEVDERLTKQNITRESNIYGTIFGCILLLWTRNFNFDSGNEQEHISMCPTISIKPWARFSLSYSIYRSMDMEPSEQETLLKYLRNMKYKWNAEQWIRQISLPEYFDKIVKRFEKLLSVQLRLDR